MVKCFWPIKEQTLFTSIPQWFLPECGTSGFGQHGPLKLTSEEQGLFSETSLRSSLGYLWKVFNPFSQCRAGPGSTCRSPSSLKGLKEKSSFLQHLNTNPFLITGAAPTDLERSKKLIGHFLKSGLCSCRNWKWRREQLASGDTKKGLDVLDYFLWVLFIYTCIYLFL